MNARIAKTPAGTLGNIEVIYYANKLPTKGKWDTGIKIYNTLINPTSVKEWIRLKDKNSLKWIPINIAK